MKNHQGDVGSAIVIEIAEVMGGKNVTPKDDIVETEQDKQALDKAKKKRKKEN